MVKPDLVGFQSIAKVNRRDRMLEMTYYALDICREITQARNHRLSSIKKRTYE